MKLSDINVRDPFILTHEGKYYLYGTRAEKTWTDKPGPGNGFDVYESCDLENWVGPKSIFENNSSFWGEYQFWAPEVHEYKGKFYLLATFAAPAYHRGTAILVCDTPNGTFKEHSKGAVTPSDWECLDGTLYVENGKPYMVFCHEWCQIGNGEVCAIELSEDLRESKGKPFTMFKATDGQGWVKAVDEGCYVTDGPFIMNLDGELICLWSSYGEGGYAEAIARSSNGRMDGEWTVDPELLFEKDGGHGMVFTDLLGKLNFTYHTPNETPYERPNIVEISKERLKKNG